MHACQLTFMLSKKYDLPTLIKQATMVPVTYQSESEKYIKIVLYKYKNI